MRLDISYMKLKVISNMMLVAANIRSSRSKMNQIPRDRELSPTIFNSHQFMQRHDPFSIFVQARLRTLPDVLVPDAITITEAQAPLTPADNVCLECMEGGIILAQAVTSQIEGQEKPRNPVRRNRESSQLIFEIEKQQHALNIEQPFSATSPQQHSNPIG